MPRILIVEDNPLNLKLASVILRAEGHEVLGATDADQSDRVIAAGVPDLILMDLALPVKDGYEYTRELRGRPALRSTPIIAITAFAMKGDRRRAIDAGCTDYLTKPIDRATLVRMVHAHLSPRARASKRAHA